MPTDDGTMEATASGKLHGDGQRIVLWAMVVISLVLALLAVGKALRSRGDGAEPIAPRQSGPAQPGTPASPAQHSVGPDAKIDLANALPGVTCGIVDGGRLLGNGNVFVWGWAYDPRDYTPAIAVILLDNGRQLSPMIRVSRERPDVVAFKKNPLLLTSGWNVSLPASHLTGDEHVFEALAILGDGKLGRLGGKVSIASIAAGPGRRGRGD